jgi:hypothetical protein
VQKRRVDGLGVICKEVDERLVGLRLELVPGRDGRGGVRGIHTFQQALDLGEFACIVQLSKVLRFLSQVFPLDRRVSLVCDDL